MNTNTTLNYPLASSCWSTARHALEDGTAPTAQKQPAAEGVGGQHAVGYSLQQSANGATLVTVTNL